MSLLHKPIWWAALLSFWGLASALVAQPTTALTGRILDQDQGTPLAGVQVSLTGALPQSLTTYTDEEGNFTLAWPAGDHVLHLSLLGYEPLTQPIPADSPRLGTLYLARSSTTLEEIVVSATAPPYNAAFKGSNFRIDPVAIAQLNPLSTEEVLRMVPGVNIVGDMGLSNRPNISIRGSWGRRSKKILLLEDGSPAAPAPYVAPGSYYNPVSDRVTAIEVYKGADMLRFGPNNMYGAVNYITAMPPPQPALRAKLAGGQRGYTTGLLSYGGTWNQLGALVEGVYKRFDGFTENASVEVLNLNAKVFTRLSDQQSLYFKVSGQFEDNQASLSSQTPFTFTHAPTANPFDADQFTMRRYGLDIIHKWLPRPRLSFISKAYASDFERDWWRQVTAKVPAASVRDYVGETIFQDRYRYMQGLTFGPDDYVIVGRVVNGREQATDSRWAFTVAGFQETMKWTWEAGGYKQELEASVKLHRETYKDRLLVADSSRWARSGRPTTDLYYHLWSASGYVRQAFRWGAWGLTPIVRVEHIDMYRQDRLALALSPHLTGTDSGRERNAYQVLLPGVTLDHHTRQGEAFASIYQGFIAPSKVFGFLVEQNGIITNPLAGQPINMQPELSLNLEAGWRGRLWEDRLDGQAALFQNTVRNFYAGGRNEVFRELGRFRIQGLEAALEATLLHQGLHRLRLAANLTLLHTQVLAGQLEDRDLFSQVIHSAATRQEWVNKVNAQRSAYTLYMRDASGQEVLYPETPLSLDDVQHLSRVLVQFGEGQVRAQAPYSPPVSASGTLTYDWRQWTAGLTGNYVSRQFTEFHNFVAESADGAIGQLPAFATLDAFVQAGFSLGKNHRMLFFLNGKNLTNQVFRASRLNRATSGIFPAGWRQWVAGLDLRL